MASTDTANRYSDMLLDGIRRVDEVAVNAAGALAQRVGGILPDELPGASTMRSIPRPEEFVKISFDFAERLIKTQRTYSLDMVKAFQPVIGKIWKPANVRKAA